MAVIKSQADFAWPPCRREGRACPPAQGKPEASLLEPQKQNAGRNNNGHITIRHKGGGHKHHYRASTSCAARTGHPGKVETIEYDPEPHCHIALVCYADGDVATSSLRVVRVGFPTLSADAPDQRPAHAADPQQSRSDSIMHCVEMMPGKGGADPRSAARPAR